MTSAVNIKDIKSFLSYLNLSEFQVHQHFHILKFEDHSEQINNQISLRSEGYFEITFSQSKNKNTELDYSKIKIDHTSIDSDKGHLLFLSPGQSLTVDSTGFSKGDIGYMIVFTADFLDFTTSNFNLIQQFPYFNMHSSPVFYTNTKSKSIFIEYMDKLYKEFQVLNKSNIEIIKSLLTIILFEIKRASDNHTFKPANFTRAEKITYLFENLIKQTPKKKQKLSYYAHKLNISTIYLSECVKKTLGYSAKKVVSEYIILEACNILSQTTNTVDQVAWQLGFDDTPNFINFFKKNIGQTPNQFRKSKS